MNLESVMTEAFGTPTPKQELFYNATTRYVGYGGSRGGGKSHGVRAKATALAETYPGIKMLIVRRTFADLVRLYVRPLQAAYAMFPVQIRPTYSSDGKIFTFPNGATIEFAFCSNDADANNYRGLEWDVIFLDEATDYSEYAFLMFNSCIRGANKIPKRLYATCNPGGQGHVHIKRLFIDQEYRRAENPKKYTFIQARMWDNIPMLMADEAFVEALNIWKREHKGKPITDDVYKECMMSADCVQALANMPEDMREAQLYGNWDVFSGVYFPEWDEDVHIVSAMDIKPWWRKTAAIDYGLDCFAVVWVAVDERGRAYVYRNIEEQGLQVDHAVERFRRASSGEQIEAIFAPPDLWNTHSDSGISTADIFASKGYPLIKSSNARESGWLSVKEYLMKSSGQGVTEGYPRMLFQKGMPINKHIPVLQHDKKKVNDVDSELNHDTTHSPDALRYWCSMRQLGTVKPEEIKPDPFKLRRPKKDQTYEFLMGGY